MKKRILGAVMSVFAVSCGMFAQTQVSAFNPGQVAEGINYALPRTVVKVDVEAIQVIYTPGEFARYAERYLHLKNISTSPSVEGAITSVNVYTEGVPDTTKIFTVKLKDKTVAPLVQLQDNGVILAVNKEERLVSHELPKTGRTNHKLNSKEYFTEEILAANSTAKMAELTAAEIYEIRESRNSIMRGQVEAMPKDGASLKIVLDELNRHEEALLQLFSGYVDTVRLAKRFVVEPVKDVKKKVLFRFSKKLGFVDPDDFSGAPYYINIKDKHTVVLPTEKDAAKRKITGLVYNMPSVANVTLFSSDGEIFSKDFPFGQFGTVDVLSSALFNKGATTKVTFDAASGGVLRVE